MILGGERHVRYRVRDPFQFAIAKNGHNLQTTRDTAQLADRAAFRPRKAAPWAAPFAVIAAAGLSNRHTGMPSFLALSARFAEIPEPGNTTTPIGNASSRRSLRLNGAARPSRAQSGLKTT